MEFCVTPDGVTAGVDGVAGHSRTLSRLSLDLPMERGMEKMTRCTVY
jgi:hypothetical protein